MQAFIIRAMEPYSFVWNSKHEFDNYPAWHIPNITNFIRVIDDTTVAVIKLPLVIGRSMEKSPNLMISNVHRSVSRIHAELFEEKGLLKIRDLGSSYGTLILRRNERPIKVTETSVELENRDMVQLGNTVKLQIIFEKS